MYGKVFESIYDGTLHGHWQAIVTMQQLIVLADQDGVVDMTPKAIADRTTIPLEIIEAGLEHLAKADPFSRTPGDDGRRIVLLDDHRPWGWRLVNHAKYRALRNLEQKREADRQRQAKNRKKNSSVAIGSRSVQKVAHTDTHTDAYADTGESNVGLKPDAAAQPGKIRELRQQAVAILQFLNEKAGKNYQPVKANVDLIVALLKQGATADDMRAVIAKKCREWKGNPEVDQYLRPATLFGPRNFWAKYQGELVAPPGAGQ